MGLLDSVIGNLVGGAGGGATPMAGVLNNLLGGGGMGQTQSQGMGGGLSGILSSFEQAGLAQPWVSNGVNQPVTPQQLQTVMGDDQVQSMSSQAGMQPNDFLSQLRGCYAL